MAGIVGLVCALQLATEDRISRNATVTRLRDRVLRGVLDGIAGVQLTGHPEQRLPNNASFCFAGVSGESLLLALDQQRVMVSTGSACPSGSLEPSHVLLATGLSSSLAAGSLRITLGHENTDAEIDRLLAMLPAIAERLRSAEAPVVT